MRNRWNRWNRSNLSGRAAVIGAVLAVALGTGVGGSAAATEDAAAVPCPTGFVCLSTDLGGAGVVYRVAEGVSAHFASSPRIREATNNTRVDYCVVGSFTSYLLRPGETRTQDSAVRSVIPRPTDGTCRA
ncbi:hypothetical protein [Streptomyces scabiei]|uniref:Uncharacterized protein n=1 Tax=Streptomyces scabiei TaxID=1930 RepID=A0A117ECG0_STRSC|nr:hypothetical protein [Streptomyces scabiei]GAQ60893.1 hypothetical protein SsS58_01235 [Streptomyces scabiei]